MDASMKQRDEMELMIERHNARRAEKERIKNLSQAEFDYLIATQWYEMQGCISDEEDLSTYEDFYSEQVTYYNR